MSEGCVKVNDCTFKDLRVFHLMRLPIAASRPSGILTICSTVFWDCGGFYLGKLIAFTATESFHSISKINSLKPHKLTSVIQLLLALR